jgi:hypothetical protein
MQVEMVVSGVGIANFYKWLRHTTPSLITDVELDAEVMVRASV